MHKIRSKFVAAIIMIAIVFSLNIGDVVFGMMPLREAKYTQELSTDKDEGSYPTQSHNIFGSNFSNINSRKPDRHYQNFWGIDAFTRDTCFDGIKERSDFACADEDSVELVIGINNAQSDAYANLEASISKSGGKVVNTVSISGEAIAVVADLPLNAVSSFTEEVQKSNLARYIEPNMRFHAQFVPNDPYWTYQWGPPKIEADYAWNTTTGDPSVLVAVIDTGIDYDHPDLADNYVVGGYDWVNGDPYPMDDNGHGTHCAGIIAAVINNSIGIAGLAQVSIMAEKALDEYGSGYEDDLANAIIHAVDQGADVLGNSWGGYGESMLIHDAVQYAHSNGVLVIAAAGNEAWSNKFYPAAYDEVVAVTATDSYDNPASFTNFGDWVEVAAPGVSIYSTYWDDWYTYMDGTSMSCPHVAGVAALIWSQFSNVTRDWVRAQLRFTADDLGDPGFDDYYGYGRINARKAVEQAPPDHDLLIFDWEKPRYIQPGDTVLFNVTVQNFGTNDENDVTTQLLVDGNLNDSTVISYLANGTSTTVSLSWNPLEERTYNVTFYVVPVPGEDVTANNVVSTFINVHYVTVALFKNADPWGNPTNEEVLSSNGVAYSVFDSSDMGHVDLSNFSKVIIASDQDQAFYDAMSIYGWWFEDYVSGGGVLEIHAADWGWNGGEWVSNLPGGLVWNHYSADYVTIVDPAHTVVTFPNEITDAELDGWSASVHGFFSNYPAYSRIVIIEDSTGYPAYLEFDYGAGAIVASSQTFEWGYTHGYSLMLENSLLYTPIQYPHELVVALEAPAFLEPGASSPLNATVYNRGLNNETDVKLRLLINGTVAANVTISQLVNGTSYTMSHPWTPSVEAIYNVTANAPPVPDENVTLNNMRTKFVSVQYPLINPEPRQYSNYILNYYDPSGSLIGLPGYFNLTYEYYVEPYKIYITVWQKDPYGYIYTGWMIVNTMNRLVESGNIWTGWWYPGWIETDIDIGSIINLMDGTATVNGTKMLVVGPRAIDCWEIPYSMYGYPYTFWHDKASGLWISMETVDPYTGNRIELLLVDTNVPIGTQYEHDLGVTLDVPRFLRPGETSMLNATVYNVGLNNETDVEIQLLINGTQVASETLDELVNGTSYTIEYLWTPTVEATYNVTAYAPPVLGEGVTANNQRGRLVEVCEMVIAVVLDSWGTDYGYNAFWDYLNTNWATYGDMRVMIDYTSLNKENITLADIEATHADVLIISDAWDIWRGWEFTDSEIEAIETYVLSGHGIIATSGTFDTWTAPNNQKLAELFGMDPGIQYNWGYDGEQKDTTGIFDLMTPRHEQLWRNIDDPYLSDRLTTLNPTPSSDWTVEGVTTGWIEALSTDHYAAVITSESITHRAIYLTCMLEANGQYNENNRQLFYNAIVWAVPSIIISITPSAGSVGTNVTVTGIRATANGTVEIYWDETFIDNTTADEYGNFTYLLTVPPSSAGLHEIKAVDVTTGETCSKTFRVIFIILDPPSGPVGAKTTVNGAGFAAESQVTITFNDVFIGCATADGFGNFTFTFNIPLSSAGTQFVKALDAEANYACAKFTVVDVTPLNVQIDVGAMHFRGEIAEFYSQTVFKGVTVNATDISAVLYSPNGETVYYRYPENITLITTGLYKILYTIPGNAETGTYTLVITASYVTDTIQANGTAFKCFLISPTLTGWNALLINVNGTVGTIKTDVDLIHVKLDTINATLISVNGTLATVDSTLGLIQTDISTINAKLIGINNTIATVNSTVGLIQTDIANIQLNVTAINGSIATIETTLGTMNGTITSIRGDIATILVPGMGEIQADISSLKGIQETFTHPLQYITIVVALIAAIGAILSIILLRRGKASETRTETE